MPRNAPRDRRRVYHRLRLGRACGSTTVVYGLVKAGTAASVAATSCRHAPTTPTPAPTCADADRPAPGDGNTARRLPAMRASSASAMAASAMSFRPRWPSTTVRSASTCGEGREQCTDHQRAAKARQKQCWQRSAIAYAGQQPAVERTAAGDTALMRRRGALVLDPAQQNLCAESELLLVRRACWLVRERTPAHPRRLVLSDRFSDASLPTRAVAAASRARMPPPRAWRNPVPT